MLGSITASLEKSLEKCCLSNHQQDSLSAAGEVVHSSSSDSSPAGNSTTSFSLDLNSHISLPRHWEQCLDLKSGEIYFINWTTGMKTREDPRTNPHEFITTHFYSIEEEDDEEEEDDSISSDSSYYEEEREEGSSLQLKTSPPAAGGASSFSSNDGDGQSRIIRWHEDEFWSKGNNEVEGVLVVAGCKVCLMYFMLPKHLLHCPKCTSPQLLHFI